MTQGYNLDVLDFGFYNMDCMEGMKHFPDKYFDLAIVDPPYGGAGKCFKSNDGTRFGGWFDKYKPVIEVERVGNGRAKKYGKKIIEWDKAPSNEYFEELFRVADKVVIWGGNYFELPPTRCFYIWRKKTISENFSMAMAEYAWTNLNDNAKVYEFAPQDKARFHPTQKPVELYEWLFNMIGVKQDYKFLDTHVGSGSSLIAAYRRGLSYVGFEIDKYYYKKAIQRIEDEKSQLRLSDVFGFNPYME